MEDLQSLRHTRWMCKFHIVWIPKCRKKKLYGQLRQDLGNVFRELARQKECQIEEGHLLRDHVHILISVPPKYAVSQVIGFIKGKSAIHIARGPLALASATLRVSISGLEAIMYRRPVKMRKPFVATFKRRKKPIRNSINSNCLTRMTTNNHL